MLDNVLRAGRVIDPAAQSEADVIIRRLNDAITALPESKGWQHRTVKDHALILDAIQAGRADAAAAAMGRHVAATEKSVTALLAAL